VTSYKDARLERIRTLLHRLAHTRDGAGEAELIGMITLETDAVRRARALAGRRCSGGSPLEHARVGVAVDFAPPPMAARPRGERRRAAKMARRSA
jgi:hypothetical protein